MNEAELIAQAQNGDVAAFNSLVLTYQELAFNVAYRVLGEPSGAADMTQEAFIAAYNALDSFKGGNFKGWLLRIVTNRCYDELRRHKRRPQRSLDEMQDINESVSVLRDPSLGPEAVQQQRELVRALETCLGDLPDDQRIAVVMCDIEGYDYNEIADIMSTSLGTVKSRMSRGRQKLRDCLQGFAELLPAEYRLSN